MSEQSFIRVGGEGQQVEVTDQAEIAEIEQAVENIAAHESKRLTDAQSVFELLQPQSAITVVSKEIDVAGRVLSFGVRQLGYAEASRIDAKRHRRKASGQLEFSQEYAETVGVAWQLSECIMRDANAGKADDDGKPLAPDWVRMFKLEEVLGKGQNDGLMGNPNPDAKELIYALTSAVWEVNEELNPLSQAQAMGQLGMM